MPKQETYFAQPPIEILRQYFDQSGWYDRKLFQGINKFILIGENVLNFHSSDDCYYEEWFEEVEEGWIATINFHEHVVKEFVAANIDQYFVFGGELEEIEWRTYLPSNLFSKIESLVNKRIGSTY